MQNGSLPRKDSLRHALERCGDAVKSAMFSEEDRATRARNAFDRYMRRLREDEFSKELWKRVEALQRKLHLEHIPDETASECLAEILSIYQGVAEAYYSRFAAPQP